MPVCLLKHFGGKATIGYIEWGCLSTVKTPCQDLKKFQRPAISDLNKIVNKRKTTREIQRQHGTDRYDLNEKIDAPHRGQSDHVYNEYAREIHKLTSVLFCGVYTGKTLFRLWNDVTHSKHRNKRINRRTALWRALQTWGHT